MEIQKASQNDSPKSSLQFYLGVYSAFWFLTFWVAIFISEYWQIDRIIKIFSFYSADGPGSVDASCLPSPIGLHYFGDFVSVVCHSSLGSPYLDTSTNYFPGAYLFMQIFAPLMKISLWLALGSFYVLAVGILVYLLRAVFKHSMNWYQISFFLFFAVGSSQPVMSLLDRGNLQVVVTLLVLLAAIEISLGSERRGLDPWVIGIATAFKGYPIIFAVPYIRNREFRKLGISIFVAISITVVALLSFSGGFFNNISAMKNSIFGFREGGSNWLRYNVSLKALFYSVVQKDFLGMGNVAEWLIGHYLVLIVILAIMIALAIVKLDLEIHEQFLLGAVFCGLLVDYTSSYVLTLLVVPLVLLMKFGSVSNLNKAYLCLIAFLMVPKGFSLSNSSADHANQLSTTFSDHMPSLASVINPLAMLALLAITITAGVKRRA